MWIGQAPRGRVPLGLMPSTTNFEELKATVFKNLESSGVLAQIRAQLRRSVYQAIDCQDGICQGAQKLCEAPWALICAELIIEFFEYHGLQHSLCVFQTEAQLRLLRRGRDAIATDAGLGQITEGNSLLQQLISRYYEHKPAQLEEQRQTSPKLDHLVDSIDGEKSTEEAASSGHAVTIEPAIPAHQGDVAIVAPLAAPAEPMCQAASMCSTAPTSVDAHASVVCAEGSPTRVAATSPASVIAATPGAASSSFGSDTAPSLRGAHMRLPPLSESLSSSLPPSVGSLPSMGPRSAVSLSSAPLTPVIVPGITATAACMGDAPLRASSKEAASGSHISSIASSLSMTAEAPPDCSSDLAAAASMSPCSPAGSSASMNTTGASGLLGDSIGSLPRPLSPHGPLPPISHGTVGLTLPAAIAAEHAGGSGAKAARASKREARRLTKERNKGEKEKECESSSSSDPALVAQPPHPPLVPLESEQPLLAMTEVPPTTGQSAPTTREAHPAMEGEYCFPATTEAIPLARDIMVETAGTPLADPIPPASAAVDSAEMEIPHTAAVVPPAVEAWRPSHLSEPIDTQEMEDASLSHAESKETLGPDASTREPTPAGIRNPAYAASLVETMGTVLASSISMSSDEEGFSENIEEDILGSSVSQESTHLGDHQHAKKAGRSRSMTEQSAASVFDSTTGADASVDSVELEKLVDHLERVEYVT